MAPDRELTYVGLPDQVVHVLRALSDAGHEAVLVGGVVRDQLSGQPTALPDWDAATSARPEEVAALFSSATWENRFGTVTIVGEPAIEVTSYRTEGAYSDRRRPDDVRFGASLEEDLARRDFTINAVAWIPSNLEAGRGLVVDPFGGARDLEAGLLRTVGDPRERFAEDALRLVRAARFAGRFGMAIDPATEEAILELAPTVSSVSAERIRDELLRILDDSMPSGALRLIERWGILPVILPELASLRGIVQAKVVPGDALDHSFAAVDAAPAGNPPLRLAALLHDIGKATTLAGGHFIGHDRVGAELAARAMHRLRVPGDLAGAAVDVIGQHMYAYDDSWTDAAVRRFIRRVGEGRLALLFALRRADNAASGVGGAGEQNQRELEQRIGRELARSPDLLIRNRLAIDGNDVQRALGSAPGPRIGRVLDRLMEAVLDDPSLNRADALLALAREIDSEEEAERTAIEPDG